MARRNRPLQLTAQVTLVGNIKRNVEPPVMLTCQRALIRLGKKVRTTAKKSIKRGSKNYPHSKPGQPTNSRTGIYPNSIKYRLNRNGTSVDIGPEYRPTKTKPDGSRPLGGTRPKVLEEGGMISATKATLIPAERAALKWRIATVEKINKQRRRKGYKRNFNIRKLKWVVIKPGIRHVKARPTMRRAFNEVLKMPHMKKAFAQAGLGKVGMRDKQRKRLRSIRK